MAHDFFYSSIEPIQTNHKTDNQQCHTNQKHDPDRTNTLVTLYLRVSTFHGNSQE